MKAQLTALSLLIASALTQPALANSGASERFANEPDNTGWAIYIDNDVLSPGSSDRDYTGGFSVTLSGKSAQNALLSVDDWRAGLDRFSGLADVYSDAAFSRHSLEMGVTVFTPQELSNRALQVGDRPYASLLYLANTAINVVPEREVAYLSTLTIGVLGAHAVANLQQGLHEVLGSEEPVGWDNQISDGGELTFRYSVARADRSWAGTIGGTAGELTTTMRASVGYLTEASIGFATRFGDIRTPWWSYNPQIADYAEKSVPIAASEGSGPEQYVWAGVNIRARAYNAFLQGQFRDSDVTFSHNELRPFVFEAWLGYTFATAHGWRYSYLLRGQSAEIEDGPADRSVLWGGLIISQSF
ncbi:lipid A deacylase LpxR family protein [Permianibacter sp. IMCC34836]|uniref:lipid A deacylase LpxR family protein n=1 Tax=Permianibacter fluminis TaxID=2738515 RepID=UPI001555C3D1|nr:lipid A deacylase LpxR family protein [Permianibacter fluminis]NQD38484.1 lipid A deacylase LpxR family protein [Permianibacter fluminis]